MVDVSNGCLSYMEMLGAVTLTKYQNIAAVCASFKGELVEDGMYVSRTFSFTNPAKDRIFVP